MVDKVKIGIFLREGRRLVERCVSFLIEVFGNAMSSHSTSCYSFYCAQYIFPAIV